MRQIAWCVIATTIGALTAPSMATAESITVVAFGDSTTAPRDNLTVYAAILQEELPRNGIEAKVINAGVGGNDTGMARRRFERDVLAVRPTVAIVQFGINDAAVDVWKGATSPRVSPERYAANLSFFVKTLKAQGATVVLMTPNPLRWTGKLRAIYGKPPYRPDDPDGLNVALRKYVDLARGVARRERVALVDIFAAFEAYGRRPGRSVGDLLLDGMHPNAKGHELVAELLLAEIAQVQRGRAASAAPSRRVRSERRGCP